METATMSDNQKKLISSFIEIAVGHPMETAIQFLEATSWNLEEAINLFFIHGQNQPLTDQSSSNHYWSDYQEEGQIPPSLPSIRDTLYDSSSMHQTSVEVSPEEIWNPKPEPSDSNSVVGSDSKQETSDSDSGAGSESKQETSGSDTVDGSLSKPEPSDSDTVVGPESRTLSSLFRPPQKLLFKGSFEDAKSTSSRQNLWLLVNLQSTTEFASHMLNRDLWSNEVVSQAIKSNFILWQAYDDTNEGKKISTFYRIESAPPVVLLLDPITGQKMQSWRGAIEAHDFVEDLMKYGDDGPHDYIASLTSNKRMKTEKTCFESNHSIGNIVAPSWKPKFESTQVKEEDTCSSSNKPIGPIAASLGDEFESSTEVMEEGETCLEFPDLTEEPKGDYDKTNVCNLCVRFPDGRRKQRKFLKSEPIQLLWSFCYSHMDEFEKKAFKLVQAIPGASKTLDYEANATFDQSGLANSIISVTWE